MDNNIIHALAMASHNGEIAFPELVGQLIKQGVEFYHVNYLTQQTYYYHLDGSFVCVELPFDNLPTVAEEFNQQQLIANIRDSQNYQQSYIEFSKRAVLAGVQSYFAFLRGQRVSYFGRQGDQHTEWFPGAQP